MMDELAANTYLFKMYIWTQDITCKSWNQKMEINYTLKLVKSYEESTSVLMNWKSDVGFEIDPGLNF